MKFCQPHWDAIRQAIKSHGVWDLVSSSGEEAMSRAVEDLDGTKQKTLERYDPLMSVSFAIYGRAVQCGGLYLMGGDYCPLCELEKHTKPGAAQLWIDGASKAAADHALTLPRDQIAPEPDL